MKKLILVFSLFLSFLGFAQQEIKLDIADALVVRSLEFSYETYISEVNSFGVSALVNLVKQETEFRYNENFMITPYFRHYFTKDAKWNFFGEAFVGINSGKKEIIESSNNFNLSYTDAALGIAAGIKHITKGGIVICAYAGFGRNMFGEDSPILVPRVGANIGWRF
ncbi:hypothetical protein [uncultured Polaribacter sp.]|uniref:DUF3575 domain-containing protein n=1 Tax=uncultured Polaribacter sp. TaxID=174711 RepID=UPI00261B7754|nr:hypothetical protein [uncultured Polaribacter sp.]